MPHCRAGKPRVSSTPSDRRGIILMSALCVLCRYRHKTHSTGHESRLARKGVSGTEGEWSAFGSTPYAREELVAEMGAAFLCGQAGIVERTIDNSATYVANWLERLRKENRLIVTAAAQAQKAADFILGAKYGEESGVEQ